MYKAVIFDLDGTLVDSVGDIMSVLNATLAQFNLPQITREQTIAYIGNGARELVRLAIGKQNEPMTDEILASYKPAYAACDNSHSAIFPGEREALLKLKASGLKLAILTNKPHAAALKAEEIFLKEYLFDLVQGQEDGIPLKPAREAVEKVTSALGVKSCECVFVGDGEADIAAAKNAGMDCVSVLWGYRTRAQLDKAGGRIFAETFAELTDLILK